MPSIASITERMKRTLIPVSLHMSFDALNSRLLDHGEPEIRALERLVTGRKTAIDVGANSGSYTYAMSRLFETVWAFEPNVETSRPISAAKLPNVRLFNTALSSKATKSKLKVPIVNGQMLSGWATMEDRSISDQNVEIDIETATLDSFAIQNVSFIKIDVEGHELDVLNGARATIARDRPVCLIEANDVIERLVGFWGDLGYALHRNEFRGARISPQNVIFAPAANS